MDKRPIAMGGGFAAIYDHDLFAQKLEERVLALPPQTPRMRLGELVCKLPTFLIYNCTQLTGFVIALGKLSGCSLSTLAEDYRARNPGFTRGKEHLRRPAASLLADMQRQLGRWRAIEDHILRKSCIWIDTLTNSDEKRALSLLPHKEASCSIYNAVLVQDPTEFIARMDSHGIVCMRNPTYRTLTSTDLLDKLVYLPCLSALSPQDIPRLATLTLRCAWTRLDQT